MGNFRSSIIVIVLSLSATLSTTRAVILFRTGDPNANTTAPTGALAGSGWQYEGFWGAFLGTPIAPHYFLSAAHIGQPSSVFNFQGTNYTIVRSFSDPESDLILWQVAETFPSYAPLYTRQDETGQQFVAFGRGTQRGAAVYLRQTQLARAVILTNGLRGWDWGASDDVERWGENVVAQIVDLAPNDQALYATFDQNGLPNECHLSVGDSGGGLFLNDNGVWKLAGVHYSVDGPFYTDALGDGEFNAALFDMRGFYYFDGNNYVLVSGPSPIPSGLYSTRISTRISWINSVIRPIIGHR